MLFDRLSTNLSIIKTKISIENQANDQSLNVLFETTALKIFNITRDFNFQNANLIEENAPGIDGIDIENKLMVQITSTFSTEKIEHTVDEILKHNLNLKYNRLIFIFLRDRGKKPSNTFINKVQNKINGKFLFDFDNDLYDLNDIYHYLIRTQDIQKLQSALNILDEFLYFVPIGKKSGFEAISITFNEEDINNVELLVDSILKEGINVYINSVNLYSKFKERKHPLFEYLIQVEEKQNLEHIKYTIVVLSNQFINNNFGTDDKNHCKLFQIALKNENKFFVICFDPYLNELKKIRETQFRSYISVEKNTIEKKAKEILKILFAESVYSTYSFNDIKESLINSYPSFTAKEVDDNKDYYFLNFNMEEQEDVTINYLILKKDYIIQTVYSHFSNIHSSKFSKNLNILVPKDFTQKTRRRLNNVASYFNNAKIFYIDEHLFDKSLKNIEQRTKLTIEEFIPPIVKINTDELRVNDIIDWVINNNESSIAIIKAAGGIGKTTICEKIHDTLIQNFDRFLVVFIDSNKYIDEFKKRRFSDDAEYDLYNIFKNCHPHGSKLSRNSFYLNFSLGNIVIIFDGIDEIISTIPSFNLNSFIAYLEKLRAGIGKGKIIINCRDTYIEDLVKLYQVSDFEINSIQIYELLAFNLELAESFFLKHFSEVKKVNVCTKLLYEFYNEQNFVNNENISNKTYIYHPFILEIIVQIVSSNFEYQDIEYDFNSDILLVNENNDLLIYRILKREILKKEIHGFDLSVDEQILFFCYLALDEKGKVNNMDIDLILSKLGLKDRLSEIKKGLIDHPLLFKTEDYFTFRFDFFNTYFKAVGIFNIFFIHNDFNLSERIINTIAFECNINSVISKSIISKINKSKLDFTTIVNSIKILFETILNFESTNLNLLHRKHKCISNIFLIINKACSSKKSTPNELILKLFLSNNGEINNFYLVDVPESTGTVFDFSEFYFVNSKINNYFDFFYCKFSNDTYFDHTCEITDVYNKKLIFQKISASFDNFDKNIKGDNSVFKILRQKNTGNKELTKYFKDYINSFYINGNFEIKIEKSHLPSFHNNNISVEQISEILLKNKILDRIDGSFITVNKNFHSKLNKFIKGAIPFLELNNSMRDFNKVILDTQINTSSKIENIE